MACGLKIWVLCILPAVATANACREKGVCQVRQLGSAVYRTRLLQCSDKDCSRAIFAPAPSEVCLIRNLPSSAGESAVRIYLGSCAKVATNEGYLLNGTGNVVSWNQGATKKNTLFMDMSCAMICSAFDRVLYNSSGGILIVDKDDQIGINRIASCQQAFYVYPSVTPSGACDDIVIMNSDETRQRVLLELTDGERKLAVGLPERRNDGSYQLPIVEQCEGEAFYIQNYTSEAIGAGGTVESVMAYTLQLVRSGQYLVADKLNDTTLRYTPDGFTGLSLEDASDFSDGYVQKPDNRLFIGYNVTAYNLTLTIFCPIFHRTFCLFPTAGYYMGLISLRGLSGSLEPTFENPTESELQDYLVPPTTEEEPRLIGVSIVQDECPHR